MGFERDIPDEDVWISMRHCEDSFIPYGCSEIDGKIVQTRTEISVSDRKELYREIEEAFWGEAGSFPVAPIYSPISLIAKQDWFEYVQSDYFEYDDFSRISVDLEAKEAAL